MRLSARVFGFAIPASASKSSVNRASADEGSSGEEPPGLFALPGRFVRPREVSLVTLSIVPIRRLLALRAARWRARVFGLAAPASASKSSVSRASADEGSSGETVSAPLPPSKLSLRRRPLGKQQKQSARQEAHRQSASNLPIHGNTVRGMNVSQLMTNCGRSRFAQDIAHRCTRTFSAAWIVVFTLKKTPLTNAAATAATSSTPPLNSS